MVALDGVVAKVQGTSISRLFTRGEAERRTRNWLHREDKEPKVGYVTVSGCYKRTVLTDCTSTFQMLATYSSFLQHGTKSSRILRVRFIRFNEDICVPLRCPLPASIDEQKRRTLDAYTPRALGMRASKSGLLPLSGCLRKRKHRRPC